MKPFDEAHFSRLINKKLNEGGLTDEEIRYINACLLSKDPAISTKCRKIVSKLLEENVNSPAGFSTKDLDLKQEYEILLAKITSTKNKTNRLPLILWIIIAVLLLLAAILFFLH